MVLLTGCFVELHLLLHCNHGDVYTEVDCKVMFFFSWKKKGTASRLPFHMLYYVRYQFIVEKTSPTHSLVKTKFFLQNYNFYNQN